MAKLYEVSWKFTSVNVICGMVAELIAHKTADLKFAGSSPRLSQQMVVHLLLKTSQKLQRPMVTGK